MSDPMPNRSLTVNVTIPASVANDFDQMQGVVKQVLNHVGCPTCHSGFDFRFRTASDFVANQAGHVSPAAGGIGA